MKGLTPHLRTAFVISTAAHILAAIALTGRGPEGMPASREAGRESTARFILIEIAENAEHSGTMIAEKAPAEPMIASVATASSTAKRVSDTLANGDRDRLASREIVPTNESSKFPRYSVPAILGAKTPRSETASRGDSNASVSPGEPPLESLKPKYLRTPKPVYPRAARLRGEQGTVYLRVQVDAQGLPVDVAVKKSSGASALDRAATATVREWRFVPAQSGGVPIASEVEVPVVFQLNRS
jgi:TonB family protein